MALSAQFTMSKHVLAPVGVLLGLEFISRDNCAVKKDHRLSMLAANIYALSNLARIPCSLSGQTIVICPGLLLYALARLHACARAQTSSGRAAA